MNYRLIFLTMLCALSLALGRGEAELLSGQVRDAGGGVVAGANIVLTYFASPLTRGTTTDEKGNYDISDLPVGDYVVKVTHIGYETILREIELGAGAQLQLDFVMQAKLIYLGQNVVSTSRRQEKALDSPASISVVQGEEIKSRPALSVAEHIRDLPGVDLARTGLVQNNVVVRGFNNIFSGALLSLTDNRISRVPSLRVNTYQFIPVTSDDIERIEVVLGPGSALYGPNSANGVMHIITHSPFNSVGTSAKVGLGGRDLRKVELRHAGLVNEQLGYKISGQYYSGTDWEEADPEETRERDFGIERKSAEVRLDYRPVDDLQAIFAAGYNEGDHIELTGLGAGQGRGWGTNFLQARLLYRDWFAQVFRNWSSAGDTYLLRSGTEITDRSSLTVLQLQHNAALNQRQRFTYGVDALLTRPDTERSIYGENEDNDSIDEFGAYLQSETALNGELDLVLALRYDGHSRLEKGVFSPRAALVFKARPDQSLRLTYNRAFGTPTALNLYLDLPSSLDPFELEKRVAPFFADDSLEFQPIDVRVQGTYTEDSDAGFSFRRDGGNLHFRSPFAPLAGAPNEHYFALDDPVFTNVMWGVGRSAVIQGFQQQVAAALTLQGLAPEEAQGQAEALAGALSIVPAQLPGLKNSLMQLDLGKVASGDPRPFNPVDTEDVVDVPRSRPTITQTYELGYKGVVGRKLVVAADLYRTRTEHFGGPLRIETPNVFLDPGSLQSALGPAIGASLQDNAAQAAALAIVDSPGLGGNGDGSIVEELTAMFTGGAAQIPYGTVSPAEAYDKVAIIMTYRNFTEAVTVHGLDLSLAYYPSERWNLSANYSWVDNNLFEDLGGIGDIALNAPKNKFKVAANYEFSQWGLQLGGRLRYNGAFPMQSGVFAGDVDSYKVVDLNLVYQLPVAQDLAFQVEVDNILDEEHREFVGAPEIGRLVLAQLGVAF